MQNKGSVQAFIKPGDKSSTLGSREDSALNLLPPYIINCIGMIFHLSVCVLLAF